MKSSQEILEYIRGRYAVILERPHMYASSPQALEDVLTWLDHLREFIVVGGTPSAPSAYSKYLLSRGFGSGNFTSRKYPPRSLNDNDRKIFKELCDFWRDYLMEKSNVLEQEPVRLEI